MPEPDVATAEIAAELMVAQPVQTFDTDVVALVVIALIAAFEPGVSIRAARRATRSRCRRRR